jgi:hypothetical protein
MIFHCTKLHLSMYYGLWIVSIKQNVNFKFQLPAAFIFLLFCKSGVIISCSASEDLSDYKISWSYLDWCKICTHLRSLNVHHFGMIKNYYIKVTFNGMTSLLNFTTIYHLVLKLIGEDRQDDHLISLHFSFRKESRLKMYGQVNCWGFIKEDCFFQQEGCLETGMGTAHT